MLFSKNRPEKDLREILRSFASDLSSLLNIKDLLKNLLKTLAEIAGVTQGNILLYESQIKSFVVRESLGGDSLIVQFSLSDAFVNYLGKLPHPLTKHDLLDDRQLIDVKESGLSFMTAVGAEAVFPMLAENKFIGLFALGPRKDGKPYQEEMLDLLNILITIGSLSVDNALLYDSLVKQNHKLSEIAQLKTQFVSTVTHELRTPLNGILGLADVLRDPEQGENLTDDQRRYVEMIHSAGEELLDKVNQILELTQFQSRKSTIDVKRVDLQAALNSVAEEFGPAFTEKNIRLKVELGHQTKVYGDAGQIRQVFQCLVENAVKFSHEAKPNEIGISASRHGDMLKVCVYDRGIGIEDKNQEIIFEDFRQIDGDLTRSYGGTGLGLTIAKKIVEMHGGRIWVESKKGEGAQFFFTLPLKPATVHATELETYRAGAPELS